MTKNKTKTLLWQKLALIIGGIFIALFVLELGLRLAGFIILSIQEHKNRLAFSKNSSYRIMCLGESTTQNQYPKFLEEALNQRSPGIKFSVIDKGMTGIGTAVILAQLRNNLSVYNPDMVVVMMGVNDAGHHLDYKIPHNFMRGCFLGDWRGLNLINLILMRIAYKAELAGFPNEVSLKREIGRFPQDDKGYIELGMFYRDVQNRLPQAEAAFKKAIELNPGGYRGNIELAICYRKQGRLSLAEEVLRKVVDSSISNDWAYTELAVCYRQQGKFTQAEAAFKKAIEFNPGNNNAYVELGRLYRDQGRSPLADKAFKKAVELNPGNDFACRVLPEQDGEKNKKVDFSEEYNRRRNEFKEYGAETINNYCKIKALLDKHGIRLVCVQYPMCSIEPLKGIFKDNPRGIIFVDNEKVFKDAVASSSYAEYFTDAFAGDFGHCTPKGNQLLAENIADAILKEISNK